MNSPCPYLDLQLSAESRLQTMKIILVVMEEVNRRKSFGLARLKLLLRIFSKNVPNVIKIILYNRRSMTKRKIKCSHGRFTDSLTT